MIYILSVGRIDSDCDWEKRASELFSPLRAGSGLKNKEQSKVILLFLSMHLFMVLCIVFLYVVGILVPFMGLCVVFVSLRGRINT